MVTVLVCGGGNGAHVCAGIGAAQPGVKSRVLTLFEDESDRWNAAMDKDGVAITVHYSPKETKLVIGKPEIITDNPEEAMKGQVDIIVITVPSFAHAEYLEALKPYIKPPVTVVGCPGRAGFEFAVRSTWDDVAKGISIMNFESLPWACRISQFGRSADVLGVKDTLAGACQLGKLAPKMDPTEMLQKVLGSHPRLLTRGHLLGVTLSPTNGCIHPEILYGRWKDWDGVPVGKPPLFYNGLDESTANLISAVSDEVMNTAKAIMKKCKVDLNNVEHIKDWYLRCYPNTIQDKKNLFTCIKTNKSYDGLVHPCKETDEGLYVPNFKYRYITEDLPFGLIVLRGIAAMVDVPTPQMDMIITWAQEKIGREFLVNGELSGEDLDLTRCPQRYGLKTLNDILGSS